MQTCSPALSQDVLTFAAEEGVKAYLPAVLEMTQHTFPNATLRVSVGEDPEIANDRHIVLGVVAEGLDVSQALEARYQWHDGLFGCCPAPLVCVFRLGLRLNR